MQSEYFAILVYIALAMVISVLVLGTSYALASQYPDPVKLSSYECGFSPFSDARVKFDVRFYLVGILFIIFDLEISFLFPWATSLSNLTSFGYWTMFTFLALLTIGFLYEWFKGALEWE